MDPIPLSGICVVATCGFFIIAILCVSLCFYNSVGWKKGSSPDTPLKCVLKHFEVLWRRTYIVFDFCLGNWTFCA